MSKSSVVTKTTCFFDDQQKLLQLDWEVLTHLLYSLDTAPSDFPLFWSLQNSLNGEISIPWKSVKDIWDNSLLKKIKSFGKLALWSCPKMAEGSRTKQWVFCSMKVLVKVKNESFIFTWKRKELLGQPYTPTHTHTHTYVTVVQSLSHVWLFATPWTAAHQVSLSLTISWSLPKFMSIELVMPSNRLILCRPFLLLLSIFPSIRIFSNELAVPIRWSKYPFICWWTPSLFPCLSYCK